MKNLDNYITERLKLTSKTSQYSCQPKTSDELINIIDGIFGKYGTGTKDNPIDLNDIDVSKIKSFIGVFDNCKQHYFDVSKWDVSQANDFSGMFYNCKNFDGDLSNWDMSNASCIDSMFEFCKDFTGKGLNNWDLKNIESAYATFSHCNKLNITNIYDWKKYKLWNVSGCRNMFIYCDRKPDWWPY